MKKITDNDVRRILKSIHGFFDVINLAATVWLHRLGAFFFSFYEPFPWYVQLGMAFIIGRVVYALYYRKLKKPLDKLKAEPSRANMENFLESAGFDQQTTVGPIPATVREQFLEQNQEKLGVIYKNLGTLIAASQAMAVSLFAQFAIMATVSYLRSIM